MTLKKASGVAVIGGMLCLFFLLIFVLTTVVVTVADVGIGERVGRQTEPLEDRVKALEQRIEVLEQQKGGSE